MRPISKLVGNQREADFDRSLRKCLLSGNATMARIEIAITHRG